MNRIIQARIADLERAKGYEDTKIVVRIGEKGPDWRSDPAAVYLFLPEDKNDLDGIEVAGPARSIPFGVVIEALKNAELAHQGRKDK